MSASPSQPPQLGASELREEFVCGARGVREHLDAVLETLAARNGELQAFDEVWAESARSRADTLDAERAAGDPSGPLFGVPVALKSNLCVRGQEVRCGSRMLSGYRPPYDATVVTRLLQAGAVLVGATHMDEFAMGSSGENSAFASARNPWDLERAPGGSSSGSAAAVAGGLVPLALGSDTGGSVRQPAALCGVLGFKPTYGRVSRYGLVAFGSSLDQVAPFARNVSDLERCLTAISGADGRDSTCLPHPPIESAAQAADARLDGLRVGVPREHFAEGLHAGVRARVEAALTTLADLGAELVELSLPTTEAALAVYYVVAAAEASSNLARFDGVRYGLRAEGDGSLQGQFAATRGAGFGDEVRRRILLGTYVLSSGYRDAWYDRAQRARRKLADEHARAFEDVDVLIGPTSPVPAFRLGERSLDPVAMYLCDTLTVPASLVGLPALSVPCGFTEDEGRSLPVGLQVCAPRMQDERCLRVARSLEAHLAGAFAVSPFARAERSA